MKNILSIILMMFCLTLISMTAGGRNKSEAVGDRSPEQILGFDIGDTCPFYGEGEPMCLMSATPMNNTCMTYDLVRDGIVFTVGQGQETDGGRVVELISVSDPTIEIDGYRVGDVIESSELISNPGNIEFHLPHAYPEYSFSNSYLNGKSDTMIYVALSNRWFACVLKSDMRINQFEKNLMFSK